MKPFAIVFLLSLARGEPLLTFPIGAPTDAPFTDQELLNVGIEFPQEPGAYFANDEQTIICIPSLLNPSVQWCSTKAVLWIQPQYVAIPKPPHGPPPCCEPPPPCLDCGPHPSVPEPRMLWAAMVAVVIAGIKRFSGGGAFSGRRKNLAWYGRTR